MAENSGFGSPSGGRDDRAFHAEKRLLRRRSRRRAVLLPRQSLRSRFRMKSPIIAPAREENQKPEFSAILIKTSPSVGTIVWSLHTRSLCLSLRHQNKVYWRAQQQTGREGGLVAAAAFYDLEGTLVSTNLVHTLGFYARNQPNLVRSFTKSAATLLSVPLFAVSDQYSRKSFQTISSSSVTKVKPRIGCGSLRTSCFRRS